MYKGFKSILHYVPPIAVR